MNIFQAGDLAYYHRSDLEEDVICIILKRLYTNYDLFYKGSTPASYFSCLINGKVETICDVWLRKKISR